MRHFLFVAMVLSIWGVRSQETPTINSDLPSIIPPSPTVASLMKFEEVPVNHYTGIPDITLPVFSSKTRSKDISVSVGLKYHPSDIQVANIASWTGMGWSLFAGGTISRTVRGEVDNAMVSEKGIYSSQNPFLSLFYNSAGVFAFNGTSYQLQDFLWNTHIKGMHDTQYDLYQFSFQGYSGRFTLSKNGEVQKLYNDTAVQLVYNAMSDSFTGYDEKGYRYVFDVRETSTDFKSIHKRLRDGTETNPVLPQSPSYTSAYHLSSIYDQNNNLVVSFAYETVTESYSRRAQTFHYFHYDLDAHNLEAAIQDQCLKTAYALPNLRNITPEVSAVTTHVTTQTRKLQTITVQGIARIQFESESGRQDMNPEARRLKKILIRDWNNQLVKSFELFHSYEGASSRLVLNRVEETGSGSLPALATRLYYDNVHLLPDRFSNQRDDWGYFNNINAPITRLPRKTSVEYCKTGVLQKMELPSGGAYVFNFGANTYSYVSDELLPAFDNESNRVPLSFTENYTGHHSENQSSFRWFRAAHDQTVNFVIETLNNPLPVDRKKGWYFSIIPVIMPNPPMINYVTSYQVDPERPIKVIRLEDLDPTLQLNYYTTSLDLLSGPYVVRFYKTLEGMPVSVNYRFRADYYDLSDEYKFVYGGGLRINHIGYFTNGNISKDYYRHIVQYPQLPHQVPDLEKKYDYSFFSDPKHSSGSLTFPRPVYGYVKENSHMMHCEFVHTTLSYVFDVVNDYNNLSPHKTHGADVGYKNVTVTTNRRIFDEVQGPFGTEYYPEDHAFVGREEFTYTSSIDEPEPYYDTLYPFIPSPNYDHRRGLMTKKEAFDNDGRLLHTTEMTYSIEEGERINGIMTYTLEDCGYKEFWNSFGGYYAVATDTGCNPAVAPHCDYHCGYPILHMFNYLPVSEVYGWARLSEKTTRDYFYEGTAASEVQTRETFSYNPLTKKIVSHSVQTDNSLTVPQTLRTDYFYHSGNSPYSQNRLAEIEEIRMYRNEESLSRNKIQYANTFSGNASWLPQTFLGAKGNHPMEAAVHYLRYDAFGNPLEAKQQEGTPVVYLWGYYNALPIAKIENATWTQVQPYVANLQSLSDTGTEAALITALDNLRTALPNAMVTTMTHKPLVGVSTVTDPKGYRMRYVYDGFNRLKEVRDMDNNLVTEHEYRYRD